MESKMHQLASEWAFETNGHKWSNNNNEAGDNYGSFIAGYQAAEKELAALRARADKMEQALKEIVSYYDPSRQYVLVGVEAILQAREVLDQQAAEQPTIPQQGTGDNSVLRVGLKFRSKVAPLCSYEVMQIFPETKEFKVKETRECQVSGTTCFEVWSIEGFEKYYNLGVYYIKTEKAIKDI